MSNSSLAADSLFLQTFQQAPIGMVLLSANGRRLRTNPCFCRLLGYREEELDGAELQDFIIPGEAVYPQVAVLALLQDKSGPALMSFRHREGYAVPLTVHAFAAEPQGIFVLYLQRSAERPAPLSRTSLSHREELFMEKIESILLESEQRYKSLFEYHPDGVFSMDLDGNYMEVNTAFEQMCGYSRDEIYYNGLDYSRITCPEDLELARAHFHNVVRGITQNFQCTFNPKHGEPVTVSVTYVPIIVEGLVAGVYGICKDITVEKRLWDELQESQRLYELISNNAMDIISYSDPEGRLQYVSPSVYRLTGYRPEELIGRPVFSLIYEEDLRRIYDYYISEGSDEAIHTYRCDHRNGTLVWFEAMVKLLRDPSGQVHSVLAVARDITERKRAEEAIAKSEEKYRRLIEDLPEGFIIHKEDRIVYANEMALRLLRAGHKNEIMNRSIYDFLDPEYKQAIEDRIRLIRSGNQVPAFTERLITVQGEPLDVEVRSFGMTFDDGPAIYSIFRDITETQKTQELLQHSEKLTMVGQMAAGIAHEIRNPLTAIKGFIKPLQSTAEDKLSYYEIVTSEINRIEQILNEPLVLAKPPKVIFRPQRLEHLLDHVGTLIASQAILSNVQIVSECEPDLPPIECDENQLKQVFINFMKNSVEAMPRGGLLHIKAARHSPDRLCIRIADQGAGFRRRSWPASASRSLRPRRTATAWV
ncbi:PAS domain S-box protein [Paenibacillus sp. P25]|nr:PAS domain S-box protein [Paenibacillus sp. P25]